ncbi:MAG: hypothetical protein ACK5LR_06275 [Mangrovibacterium sp.]
MKTITKPLPLLLFAFFFAGCASNSQTAPSDLDTLHAMSLWQNINDTISSTNPSDTIVRQELDSIKSKSDTPHDSTSNIRWIKHNNVWHPKPNR